MLPFCPLILDTFRSVTRHPSSVIRHPSSVIRHPSSVIRHPSSVIRHPSSVTRHQSVDGTVAEGFERKFDQENLHKARHLT
jgi:hypothetical protein